MQWPQKKLSFFLFTNPNRGQRVSRMFAYEIRKKY